MLLTYLPQVSASITIAVPVVWQTWTPLINNPEQSVNIVTLLLSVSQPQGDNQSVKLNLFRVDTVGVIWILSLRVYICLKSANEKKTYKSAGLAAEALWWMFTRLHLPSGKITEISASEWDGCFISFRQRRFHSALTFPHASLPPEVLSASARVSLSPPFSLF